MPGGSPLEETGSRCGDRARHLRPRELSLPLSPD